MRTGLLAPFRRRDFTLLWLGLTVSLLGDGVFMVALAWQVYELSNAPAALSAVGVAMTLPHLAFLLVGGALSDRLDRRRLMIAADAARAAAIGLLAALSISGALELWHLLPIMVVYGVGAALFGPAFDAVVPDVVPPGLLPQANAVDQLVRPAALRLAGPAIGGGLISVVGVGGAFGIDAATFLVSIVCVALVRTRRAGSPGAAADGAGSYRTEIREGFRFVRERVWLWGTFAAATFAYLLFLGPIEVLLPYLVKNEMHGSAGDLGLVFAAGGVGGVLGAITMGRRGMPRRPMVFIFAVWSLSTLLVAGYGLSRLPWQAMAVSLGFSMLEAAGTVVWLTVKQANVPGTLLGRVSSFDWFISIGLVPVSFALTGPAAALLGARTTLLAAGLLGSAVTVAFLFLPGMRGTELAGVPAEFAPEPDRIAKVSVRGTAEPRRKPRRTPTPPGRGGPTPPRSGAGPGRRRPIFEEPV